MLVVCLIVILGVIDFDLVCLKCAIIGYDQEVDYLAERQANGTIDTDR